MGMAHKELEKLEFAEREPDLYPVDEDLVGVEVEAETAALEHLVWCRHLLAVGTPHDGAYARHELTGAEGFGHVVVRPELEPEDAVHLGCHGGQHDDGQRLGRLRSE